MPIISVTNQKGGVGKTSILSCLARYLTKKGYKVLVIDLDPQCNTEMVAGENIRIKSKDHDSFSVLNLLNGECTAKEAIVSTNLGDMIRAHPDLSSWSGQVLLSMDDYLKRREDPVLLRDFIDERAAKIASCSDEEVLRTRIKDLAKEYDYVICDTNPSLTLLTTNALYASDYVLIPALPDEYSRTAVNELWKVIHSINYYDVGHTIKVAGIVMNRVVTTHVAFNAYQAAYKKMAERMDTVLFNAKIRQSVSVGKATSEQMTVVDYLPHSDVSYDLDRMTDEFIRRIKQLEQEKEDASNG